MKRLSTFGLLGVLLVVLAGCSPQNSGFFQKNLIEPFANLIHFTATLFNGDYGIAIILITLLIRLVLAPFFIRMYKNQREMKVKMDAIKPKMTEIQKKIKATKDRAEQQKYQQEMMQLYQQHGVNPMNMGCLPILIQMPILMGFYYAIRTSTEIASHSFLWFSLGHSDTIMAIIACAVYLVQFQVSQINMPEQQKKTMRFIGLISPVFILIMSLNYPAVLALYWTFSGLFMIAQTLLSKKLYPPLEQEQVNKA